MADSASASGVELASFSEVDASVEILDDQYHDLTGQTLLQGAAAGRSSITRLQKHVQNGMPAGCSASVGECDGISHTESPVVPPGPSSQPIVLEVRFSWLNIHSVSTEDQEFAAEFYVDARVRGGYALLEGVDGDTSNCFTPKFHIQNMKEGELLQGHHDDEVHGEDACYRRHWRGVFQEEFALHNFPYDIQDFYITLVEHSHDRPVCMVKATTLPSIFHVNNFALKNVWRILGEHEIIIPTAFNAVDLSVKVSPDRPSLY